MFVHIHFQKYNRYGFWEAIYITTLGVQNNNNAVIIIIVVKSFCFISKAFSFVICTDSFSLKRLLLLLQIISVPDPYFCSINSFPKP